MNAILHPPAKVKILERLEINLPERDKQVRVMERPNVPTLSFKKYVVASTDN